MSDDFYGVPEDRCDSECPGTGEPGRAGYVEFREESQSFQQSSQFLVKRFDSSRLPKALTTQLSLFWLIWLSVIVIKYK